LYKKENYMAPGKNIGEQDKRHIGVHSWARKRSTGRPETVPSKIGAVRQRPNWGKEKQSDANGREEKMGRREWVHDGRVTEIVPRARQRHKPGDETCAESQVGDSRTTEHHLQGKKREKKSEERAKDNASHAKGP